MSIQRLNRRSFLAGVGAASVGGLTSVAGCLGGSGGSDSITIFHAGSLDPPFTAAETAFEEETGIDVKREPKGSVASTKKITEQGRKADVLGVSDFRLIRNRVVPDYGDWYTVFVTNAMAIQHREDSPGADEIGTDNWWEVLSRDDVTIGHSDPAADPGGYRAVMMFKLGATEFQGKQLYSQDTLDAITSNTTVPTGTETNLEGQLASGKLDYAIYYQSIAATSDHPWVDPQQAVDLSQATPEYASHYADAEVETESGTFTGAPIAYGMTVPDVAENPEGGAKWIEYLIGGDGTSALTDKGLQPVSPAVVPSSGSDAVPDRVMEHATARDSLGPLDL